ncbi:MAG: HlyD family efflux transporter periplasmic adaptor subunit [Desulfobacteraceae bacterium]|jgi:hypothetical protein
MEPANLQNHTRRLSAVLQFEQQLRHAENRSEFEFLVVNETHTIVPFRQAVLWRWSGPKSGRIDAISGLASLDRQSPFILWLTDILKTLPQDERRSVTSNDFPSKLASKWQEWLPEYGFWLPLKTPKGKCLGALFLSRDEKWQKQDFVLLELLADIFGYSWGVLLGNQWWKASKSKITRFIFLALILVFISMPFIPVRMSALAPAEVIPLDSTIVRNPVDGVIADFYVNPNDPVQVNDRLFSLDDTTLRNRLLSAKKSLAVSEAEYQKAMRKAISSPGTKAELELLKKRTEEKSATVTYVTELLDRINVKANQDGIAIFSDTDDWIGKPVAAGEKVLTLADPEKAELEIRIPVADAINFEKGADVLFFLNISPESPVSCTLTHASYRARVTADGFLAYRLKAEFQKDIKPPRIGLMGTAKIYGKKTSLFYFLGRRTMAAIRQKLGL